MTGSKAYNLRIYCKLNNIEKDSSEGEEFFKLSLLEQLNILKDIREANKKDEEEVVEENFGSKKFFKH
jgi:hypothetical protein